MCPNTSTRHHRRRYGDEYGQRRTVIALLPLIVTLVIHCSLRALITSIAAVHILSVLPEDSGS